MLSLRGAGLLPSTAPSMQHQSGAAWDAEFTEREGHSFAASTL